MSLAVLHFPLESATLLVVVKALVCRIELLVVPAIAPIVMTLVMTTVVTTAMVPSSVLTFAPLVVVMVCRAGAGGGENAGECGYDYKSVRAHETHSFH
jgi:hypothetical protein